MHVSISGSAKKAALVGAGVFSWRRQVSGCQGTQTTPTAPTAQPTVTSSNNQATGQLFGGMLPTSCRRTQRPASAPWRSSREPPSPLRRGAPDSLQARRPIARRLGRAPRTGRSSPARVVSSRGDRAARFQGGQGQRGQGGQLPGGPAQGAFSSGSATVVSLEPGTKYFKGVIPAASDLSGAPGGNPPGATPRLERRSRVAVRRRRPDPRLRARRRGMAAAATGSSPPPLSRPPPRMSRSAAW